MKKPLLQNTLLYSSYNDDEVQNKAVQANGPEAIRKSMLWLSLPKSEM